MRKYIVIGITGIIIMFGSRYLARLLPDNWHCVLNARFSSYCPWYYWTVNC